MRRKVWLFFVCGLVLPLVVAATASAQGSTLLVDVPEPTPGQVITLTSTGSGITAASGTSSITIRLSTRSGQVLASPTPNSAGHFTATFPVPPSLSPGWYLLLATQTTTANNRQRAFTPGRTRIRVRAPGSPRSAAPPGGGGGLPGSPLGLLAVGSALTLLATGATLTARRLRTRPQLGGLPT